MTQETLQTLRTKALRAQAQNDLPAFREYRDQMRKLREKQARKPAKTAEQAYGDLAQ